MTKRILVTGGAGFIGSNFIRYVLKNTDDYVINLDALTYAGNTKNFEDLLTNKRYNFIHGNILNRTLVEWLISSLDIDTIVHFAAETHVDRSIVDPESFFETNVMGTFRILDAMNKYNPDIHYHHVSTDEVYGSVVNGSSTEESPYKPNSPYAASKASSDHVVRSFGHTYELRYTISNCSNNYGPYQFPEKLIPRMILSALSGHGLPVHGDGTNVRDWLYVDDHSSAIMTILEKGVLGESYNIGANEERQNIEVVNKICELLKNYHPTIEFTRDRLGNDRRYSLDVCKLYNLGWKPSVFFDEGLEKTVQWYLENLDWLYDTKRRLEYSGHDLFYRRLRV